MRSVTLTMDSTHGTFEYVGDGNGTQDTRTLDHLCGFLQLESLLSII